MKKWYLSIRVMLVSALVGHFAGCASTAARFSQLSGRDRSDQKVADIDGKADKDKSAKASKAKLPDATAKRSTDKAREKAEDGDRIVARPIDPKAAKTPQSPASGANAGTNTAANARVASQSTPKAEPKTTAKTSRPQDPFADDPATDTLPLSVAAKKPGTPPASGSVAQANPRTSRTATAALPDSDVPAWARDATNDRASVSQANAEIAPGTRTPIQEVSHQGQRADLPDWAIGEVSLNAKAEVPANSPGKPVSSKSITQLQPGAPAPAASRPVGPNAPVTAAPRSTLAQLCPSARGEVRQLVQSLDSNDLETIKRTIHRLGRMQTDAVAASPALRKLLVHKDGFVRVHAALALVRMQQTSSEVTDTLIFGLRSPDPGVRSFSAAVLAEMGPSSADALPALSAALHDRDGYVRLHVAEVLISHNDWSEQSLQTLIDCLRDRDENVRWLTTYSLAELAPQSFDAVSGLTNSLRDSAPKVRVGAAYALGEVGPLARSAVPELLRCADTNDSELQIAAAYALRQIRQE